MNLTSKQVQKYKDKTIPKLIKKAEEVFNAYIRQRDSLGGYFICISCGMPKSVDQMNAGHYKPAGHNGAIRFHEDNVNGQCIYCNLHQHGNTAQYRLGLIKKIGLERVEILERTARTCHKWSREGLIWVIETYKDKIK